MIDWDKNLLQPLQTVFGEAVLYIPLAAQPFTITGVFDEAYREIIELDGLPVSAEKPVLGVRLAEFPDQYQPEQNDHVVIKHTNQRYVVKEVRPDGHGSAKLILMNAGQG